MKHLTLSFNLILICFLVLKHLDKGRSQKSLDTKINVYKRNMNNNPLCLFMRAEVGLLLGYALEVMLEVMLLRS